ncbi:MAG: hypothetical protein GY862_39230 [Gammaproteobacteria bacterium]|nr:hypothetical protein [Gammaproteobacteria bacterium]
MKAKILPPVSLQSGMLLCAILLFFADVYFSLQMYTSIPDNGTDKLFYGAVSVIFAVCILILSGAIPHMFRQATITAIIGCIMAAVALFFLEAMSLTSSFGRTATVIHAKEQEILNKSEAKKAAVAMRDAGQAQAASLARYADSGKADVAERRLTDMQAREAELGLPLAFPFRMSRYMESDCTPKTDHAGRPFTTRAANLCDEWVATQTARRASLATVRRDISATTAYVEGHASYIGQMQHNASLQANVAAVGGFGAAAALPMYAGLSKVDLAVKHYGTADPEGIKNAFIARFVILVSLLQPLLIFLSQALPRRGSAMHAHIEAEYRQLEAEQELHRLALMREQHRTMLEQQPAGEPAYLKP